MRDVRSPIPSRPRLPTRGSGRPLAALAALALTLGLAGPACDDEDEAPPVDTARVNIVGTARAAGTFMTLLAAATAADLVPTLDGPGPFTVFAPTDAAFAKLPAGTVDDLLKPENKAMLQAVLKYHLVAGRVLAADVVQRSSVATLEGRSVRIAVSGGAVKLNDTVTVTATDIQAANGVIHVLDGVLLPP